MASSDLRASALEKLCLLKSSVVNGIRYGDYGVDYEKVFEQISSAPLRDGDVLLGGFMRSGNHWLFEIVNMILTQSAECTREAMHKRVMEIMGEKVHERVAAIPDPRVITCHLHPCRLPQDVHRKSVKLVYALRNPKDALVSWYGLATSYKRDNVCFQGSWEEFLELQLTDDFLWGSWFSHVMAWEKFLLSNPSVPVHVVQYERLKEEPAVVIRELCQFLGQPEVLSEQIAEASSFERMKVDTWGKSKEIEENYLKSGRMLICVRGEVKTWKEKFTVEQSERFDRVFEEKMQGSKLADLVRRYIQ